jgi:glyoxylase-like metal-dependent hydrolase (beta-lactamase superfamily II)
MRSSRLAPLVVLAPALFLAIATFGATMPSPYTIEALAEGVHLFRPASPGPSRANSLVVVRKDGLLVVDAQPTPESARELLAAIQGVSTLPVRYLVLTHPHAAAAGGASAFPESTLVVGTAACRFAMADPAFDFGAESRREAADPAAWREPARRLPVLTITAPTTLEDPAHAVQLVPLPWAHTRGDLLVTIPDAGIVAVGHLIGGSRNPYPKDAHLGGWMIVLNDLEEQGGKRFVPLNGPPLEQRNALVLRDSLLWVKGQVLQMYVDRVAPGTMAERIAKAPDAASHFDLDVSPSYLREVAEQAVAETEGERRRRGYDTPPSQP